MVSFIVRRGMQLIVLSEKVALPAARRLEPFLYVYIFLVL